MAKVIITRKLEEEINRLFKKQSIEIFNILYSLQENPKKGKPIAQVGGILIKEIKYEGYRFYCITDGYKVKMCSNEDLKDLLIKFIRMSNKKDQQVTIDKIKYILRTFGKEGF